MPQAADTTAATPVTTTAREETKTVDAIPAGHLAVKPGRPEWKVRIPERGLRPMRVEGELVLANTYWQRRLRAGDVVEIPAADWAAQQNAALEKAKAAEAKTKAQQAAT